MTTRLWWIRRDLRLRDNSALAAALAGGQAVVPVFVLDPALLRRPAANRQAFLFTGLRALDADLRARGSRLVVRRGSPQAALARLAREVQAESIHAEEDYSPYARQRDQAVMDRLPLHLHPGVAVHHPSTVIKKDGSPYTVFTPFSRAWKALPPPGEAQAAPRRLPPVPPELESLDLPPAQPLAAFPAGEAEALRRLKAFTGGGRAPIFSYSEGRNRLDLEATSALSPYLRFGMLSARAAAAAAREALRAAPEADGRRGAEAWLGELIWREFYLSILYHFPQVLRQAFRPGLRGIAWLNDREHFQAWCDGRTGYPVVDAAMRQLRQTGWMHNRARMIAASFLVKDLLIDWQWGERWFSQHLVDGDPASNNGGWQWTAGVGTDAAPYFRVFNPVLQSRKFDPRADYLRDWLPELRRVPLKHAHAPWEMPPEEQAAAGCVIGRDYPAPIVDHGLARERALTAYQEAQRVSGESRSARR